MNTMPLAKQGTIGITYVQSASSRSTYYNFLPGLE
jgi:hypothetical protein